MHEDEPTHLAPNRTKFELSGKTDVASLDYNVAALLCYVPMPLIGIGASIVWLVTEPKGNTFVRFHAMQSLLLGCATFAASMAVSFLGIFTIIPVIGVLLGGLGALLSFLVLAVWFVLSIVLMLKAKEREMYKLPVLGDYAEKFSA